MPFCLRACCADTHGGGAAPIAVPAHVPAGVSLHDYKLDTSKWQLQNGPYEVAQLSVASAEVVWPTWQDQVLRVRVNGVKLELLQRCMAKVG